MEKHFQWQTSEEMDQQMAERVRGLRKRRKISQEELSKQSGVSYGSIKRFERTGMISLLSLTKIAIALGCQEEITEMFTNIAYGSLQEVINERR
nr:helix-turn-helix transcriptional regulator [Eubacterium sp.]